MDPCSVSYCRDGVSSTAPVRHRRYVIASNSPEFCPGNTREEQGIDYSKKGNIMEKLHYIIQETFASTDASERERRMQSLMNTYLRTLEKQIAQNEALE